ncbi:cyclin-T1-3 [Dendrobium catenatum]|uniref:cyclin-T1-3 n=1 Tax=Dendrobium catenatum TaxID=906689 RepID=UPI0009F5F480|nr:cyclin-T1-3 [Dendrobium catenatum]
MAGYVLGDSSFNRTERHGQLNTSEEELDNYGARWYFSRKEIEENSPSRRDGIDLKKEAYFRKTYCTFLQDLGMRLKVPQVTIATAIVFCHRFFLRQSHSKSDRMTIATVCMFLAGKVEETPRPLKDVILISYEIIHKKDPSTVQRIKQKEVYEQQKELILLGERLVLATLGFDLNLLHPYKPLVEAIKKFKVAQHALAQVAWNFVNDGLRTSLFLQFKPHQIAAGAIFLAAKFLKVKLPSDGEKVWWQEFDVTPRQLEDVSNQMLELYEQNRTAQPSHGNEAESSSGAGTVNPPAASLTTGKNSAPVNAREGAQILQNRPLGTQQVNLDGQQTQNNSTEHGSASAWDHLRDGDGKETLNYEAGPVSQFRETALGGVIGDKANAVEAMTKIDKDKVKAALEKRRKLQRNVVSKKNVVVDDDDLIERELENGIELAAEDKIRKEERDSWPKPLRRLEQLPPSQGRSKQKSSSTEDGKFDGQLHEENTEEGELSSLDEHDFPFPKLQSSNGKVSGVKRRPDEKGWSDFSERDLKRMR